MKALLLLVALHGIKPGASVVVRNAGGAFLAVYAVGYRGTCDGEIPLANPLIADAGGTLRFCVIKSASLTFEVKE